MKPIKSIVTLFAAVLLLIPAALAKDYLVYFGTFTNATSKGIYLSHLDSDTGKLTPPQLAAEIASPNFLAPSPDGKFLYAATRPATFNGQKAGAVSVFTVDTHTGALKLIDQKYCGGSPCHISVAPSGQAVFAANYNEGSVKSFHVNADGSLTDGTLDQQHGSSVNTNRQTHAYAHCMVPAPGGHFAFSCDLGMDKVLVYHFDTNAALTLNQPAFGSVPPGSGPRHLAFSPNGKFVYVINEMGCSVTTFSWNAKKGTLKLRDTVSLLPPGTVVSNNFTAAEIAVRPDGRFVYGTVRGRDSISVMAANPHNGKLSLVQTIPSGGQIPRGMGIDPTGHWLLTANQNSSNVVVFAIDAATGKLTPTGQTLSIGMPVDVKFIEAQP